MSSWTSGNYTKKGLSLLTKLTQGSSLKITRAVVGTGYVKPDVLANQTAVSGIKQNLRFKAASYPETGTCKLPMFLTNEGLTTGYKARQVGLYAMDPDEGEILYFISQSESGMDVPSETIMPEYSATWAFYFRYGQADNVNVTVDPSHTITEDMLNEVRIIAETGVSDAKHGGAIAIDNTANLPFVNLKLYGKTTQIGTPTPENPADLIGVENPVVSVTGLNIWDEETELGYWQSVNGEAYTATNQIRSKNFIPIIPNATIYVTAPNNKMIDFVFYDRHKSFLSGKSVAQVITAPSEAYYMHINLRSDYGTTYKNNVCVSMISLNGAYEKTSGKQAIAIPHTLNGIPVASGGNYTDTDGQQWLCDEIDFERGVYVQRVSSIVLDGSDDEQWVHYQNQQSRPVGAYCFRYKASDGKVEDHSSFCSHFDNVTNAYINGNVGQYSDYGNKTENLPYKYFVTEKSSLGEWTAWLAVNPITLMYALATPIETALSFAELEAYNALASNNPHTTIINDGGANMEADCFLAQHETAFERIFNNTNTKAKKATEITDNAVAMVKDVHEDSAPYAKVLEIGGMTRKCLNLLRISAETTTKNGVTFTVSNGAVMVNGTATEDTTFAIGYAKIKANTPYAFTGCPSGGSETTYFVKVTGFGNDVGNGFKFNCPYDFDGGAVIHIKSGYTASNLVIKPMLNEGTEPLPYEPYFEGLRSASVEKIESVGANLFDINAAPADNGTANYMVDKRTGRLSGTFARAHTPIRWKIKVHKNDLITFGFTSATDTACVFQVSSYYQSSFDEQADARLDMSKGAHHATVDSGDFDELTVTIYSNHANESFDISGVMINYGAIALPYTPYRRNTLPIPAEVQASDGYGWGISDKVYNYIDFEKKQFVKRVGCADLGTLNWTFNGVDIFYAGVLDKSKGVSNFLSGKYPKANVEFGVMDDGTITGNASLGDIIYVKDSAYTDAATLKAAMSGVMLYYELAEPVITDISDILPDDNLIGVECGGTVTMVNEYGYDTPNTVEFSIGNNAAVGSRSFVGDLHGTAARAKADENGKPLATQEWVLEQLASLAAATLALNQ